MKAFLDLETGGFSITKNGICEISLIAVDENLQVVDSFYCLIKPYTRENSEELVSYKWDSMKVNGLTIDKLIEEGDIVENAILQLFNFIIYNDIDIIIGHNSIRFDFPRIKYLLKRFMGYNIDHIKQEDTMIIAKRKLHLNSYALENLCFHFDIKNTEAHTAEGDVLTTIEIYKALQKI